MECWGILGISKTNNKSKIKIAYIEKLKQNHPEENPEGFKRVRKAYEDALKSVVKVEMDTQEKSSMEENSIEEWLDKVKKLYSNFIFRVNVDKWKELFDDDICFQIDSRDEAGEKLLIFLMENYYIPYDVWKLIDEYFYICDNEQQLKKSFDNRFIDFVIYNINNKGSLDYNYFSLELNKNYDLWISLYYQLKQQIYNFDEVEDNNEEIERNIDKIEKLGIYNPCLNILLIQYMIKVNKIDRIRILLEGIGEDYKWNLEGLFWKAEGCKKINDFNTAKNLYETILKENYRYNDALLGLAQCLKEEGEIEIALGYFYELQPIYSKRDCINKCIEELEAQLINYYEYNIDILDIKSKFKLARLYISKNDLSKALDLLSEIELIDKNTIQQYYEIIESIEEKLGNLKSSLDYFNRVSSNSNIIMNKVRILIKMKKYEEALRIINEIMLFESYDDECYFWSAEANFNLKNYAEAIKNCNSFLKNNPLNINGYSLKKKIYSATDEVNKIMPLIDKINKLKIINDQVQLFKIKTLVKTKRFQKALEVSSEFMKRDNIKKEIKYDLFKYLAIIYCEIGDLDNSLMYIQEAIQNNKESSTLYSIRAEVYTRLKMKEEAINDYNYAINMCPEEDSLYIKKAESCKKFQLYNEAIECYEKAIEINYEIDKNYYELGYLYIDTNRYDDAINCFLKFLNFNKDRPEIYGEIYTLQIKIMRYKDAIETLNVAIDNGVGLLELYKKRAEVYEYLGDFNKSFLDYKKVLELYYKKINTASPKWRLYNDIAIIYMKINKFDDAIRLFNKSIEMHSDNATAYRNLGDIYYSNGNYERALGNYQLESTIYNSYHLLLKIAKCYIKLGRRGEGRNILSQIIYFTLKQENLNEEDSEFYNDIGQCYFYLDKNIKAIKYFKKALVGKKCSRCKFSQCYKGYLYLGMVYEKKCNKEKALEYYNIASSINGCKVCSMAIKRIT